MSYQELIIQFSSIENIQLGKILFLQILLKLKKENEEVKLHASYAMQKQVMPHYSQGVHKWVIKPWQLQESTTATT